MATPHWDDAPTWANWLAQDEDGNWHWFESKPYVYTDRHGNSMWARHNGRFRWARRTPNYRIWGDTLASRPNAREQH